MKLLQVVPKERDVDILVAHVWRPIQSSSALPPTTHQGAWKMHMRLESGEGSKSSHLQRSA